MLDAKANILGQTLGKSQISHYNPQINRCYVQLTALTADTTNPLPVMTQYLYDGQTGEILAVAQTRKGVEWSFVNDQGHQAKTLAHAGWDDASEYINAMMADDQKQ